MTCRPIRALERDERGFSLVEVMIGMGIFAVIAMGFAATMAASLRTQLVSRERTTAQELVATQVEDARRTAYDDLGTSGGNPPGVLAPVDDVEVDGETYVVRTAVELVDDQVPGTFRTYANFKRLTVSVHDDQTGKRLARARTDIAPPTKPSLIHAVVLAKLLEMDETDGPAGVDVQLSGGPSASRTAVTDEKGEVVFAALTPTPETGPLSKYRVSVGSLPPGWTVLADDLAATNVEQPALATQRVTVELRAYKASALDLSLLTGGTPFTGPATVTVSSPDWGSETFEVTGGHLALGTVASRPVMTGVTYDVVVTAPGLAGSVKVKPSPEQPSAVFQVPLAVGP